jgi:hypothetical protein
MTYKRHLELKKLPLNEFISYYGNIIHQSYMRWRDVNSEFGDDTVSMKLIFYKVIPKIAHNETMEEKTELKVKTYEEQKCVRERKVRKRTSTKKHKRNEPYLKLNKQLIVEDWKTDCTMESTRITKETFSTEHHIIDVQKVDLIINDLEIVSKTIDSSCQTEPYDLTSPESTTLSVQSQTSVNINPSTISLSEAVEKKMPKLNSNCALSFHNVESTVADMEKDLFLSNERESRHGLGTKYWSVEYLKQNLSYIYNERNSWMAMYKIIEKENIQLKQRTTTNNEIT